MTYPFRNLVFEGGGVKGIAYVGAMEILEKRDILSNIKRVGGTSAGAINAVLCAAGFTNEETRQVLAGLEFTNFLDDEWGILRDGKRLIEEYRADSSANGSAASWKRSWATTTRRSSRWSRRPGNSCTSTEPISRRASVRCTLLSTLRFFRAVRNGRGDVFVDGGLLSNYPIRLFDREKYVEGAASYARRTEYYEAHNAELRRNRPQSSPYVYNRETLGFRLDSKREIAIFRDGGEPPREEIDDFFDYVLALIRTIMEAQGNQHLHADDWHRTVYIDTLGVGTTDFDLSDERKQALIESGRTDAERYFRWYDDLENDPAINHPEAPE
jgi:NTE family protein